MNAPDPIDAVRLGLSELRLRIIRTVWTDFAARADKEGWPAARFLAAMAEHELAERGRRRIERHLTEVRPPSGLDVFDFDAVPVIFKAKAMVVAAGDACLKTGAKLLLFGPPSGSKSHLAAAISLALVEVGSRVLFTQTTDLVQKLQVARRELELEATLNRLDRFDLLIIDDLAFVTENQVETSVLKSTCTANLHGRR